MTLILGFISLQAKAEELWLFYLKIEYYDTLIFILKCIHLVEIVLDIPVTTLS